MRSTPFSKYYPLRCWPPWWCCWVFRRTGISTGPCPCPRPIPARCRIPSPSQAGWSGRRRLCRRFPARCCARCRRGKRSMRAKPWLCPTPVRSALETVKELEDTELKLQQLQFARSSFLDSDAALRVDSDVSDSILGLRTVGGRGRLLCGCRGHGRGKDRRVKAQLQL